MIVKKGQGLLVCLLQARSLAGFLVTLAGILGRNRVEKTQIGVGCWIEMNLVVGSLYLCQNFGILMRYKCGVFYVDINNKT
jgi:hypothetical protein